MEGGESDAGSVKRTKVAQAFPDVGSKMLFLFDYGDEWQFKVEVIGLGEKVPKARYPKVIKSVGTAPPQYPDPTKRNGTRTDPAWEPCRRTMAGCVLAHQQCGHATDFQLADSGRALEPCDFQVGRAPLRSRKLRTMPSGWAWIGPSGPGALLPQRVLCLGWLRA